MTDYDFRASLEGIVEDGHEALARQRELDDERSALIASVLGDAPAAPSSVRVVVDDRYLVEAIEFDEAARDLPPSQLLQQITAAIMTATARPVPVIAPIDLLAAAEGDPEEGARFLDLLAGLDFREPERFADDFGNFGVSAQLGSVTSIDALDRWVTTSPLRLVGEEIARISRTAMVATDRLGWHTIGGGAR
ncbi:hypothetical protein BH11ACT5_BH11ACT5_20140 [soil metagenome]